MWSSQEGIWCPHCILSVFGEDVTLSTWPSVQLDFQMSLIQGPMTPGLASSYLLILAATVGQPLVGFLKDTIILHQCCWTTIADSHQRAYPSSVPQPILISAHQPQCEYVVMGRGSSPFPQSRPSPATLLTLCSVKHLFNPDSPRLLWENYVSLYVEGVMIECCLNPVIPANSTLKCSRKQLTTKNHPSLYGKTHSAPLFIYAKTRQSSSKFPFFAS